MGTSFTADPGELRHAARLTSDAARALLDDAAALHRSLAAHRNPWGNDRHGHAFAARHQADAVQVLAAIDRLARAVDAAGHGLAATADGYDGADHASSIP